MQGIFWFFLGGLVYLVLDRLILFYKKIKFINDVKIHSIKLIGFAYEQFVFTMTAKYISLQNSNIDSEKIKIFKNTDEAAFEEWKRQTVIGLRESVPPIYRDALEIENWDDVMKILDNHYKKCLDDMPFLDNTFKEEGEKNV
tara:strand:+ start:3210 stop:3635 length:426 start_codon:yes stop_codon:yes gene_type:complete